MKYLCGRLKFHSFAGTVIQSVFDHLNFLVIYVFHRPLLWHIVARQAIDVLVRTALQTGQVTRVLQRYVNQRISRELFFVVVGQRVDFDLKACRRFDERMAYRVDRLFGAIAMTAYSLLRSTAVMMACLWLAPMTTSYSK